MQERQDSAELPFVSPRGGDAGLSAPDRKLTGVHAAAKREAANQRPPVLEAEQRRWIKGRGNCSRSEDMRACVRET
ncbi:hypothetical protein [Accumulibacter sp.]|uniref:hypothetical protein n=1 Tax=Accumulibacter sp. TaxID=2053492 RepID=UPI0025D8CF29|nr:hypothetical protein [Accumulibacter sp.]MCM8595342.1 hypothetical protein [Accumulibacter sp.]MCM8625315.1 hypothetical protein [Accumulibacter sp.]MDS4049489.1 hypothetical protein [Accumulibacter sp.]